MRCTVFVSCAIAFLTATATAGDTCATAEFVTTVPGGWLFLPGRTLSPTDQEDFFWTEVEPGIRVTFVALFEDDQGDVDLRIWNADCTELLAESSSDTDDERATWQNATSEAQAVRCEVYAPTPLLGPVTYTFGTNFELVDCTFDDDLEENDSCGEAQEIPYAYHRFLPGRIVRAGDDDYYEITVPGHTETAVRIQYELVGGDIDARLLADDCVTVLATSETDGVEELVLDNYGPTPRTFVVHVYVADGAECNDYSINWFAGVGYSYCPSTPNSTGEEALMLGSGSPSVSSNDLFLGAATVPLATFGIFFYGPEETSIPFGNGTLCVGPGVVRSPVFDGFKGSLYWFVDYDELQHTPNPIAAGATYNFQCWFRDPAGGGAQFDLSDGYRITFVH